MPADVKNLSCCCGSGCDTNCPGVGVGWTGLSVTFAVTECTTFPCVGCDVTWAQSVTLSGAWCLPVVAVPPAGICARWFTCVSAGTLTNGDNSCAGNVVNAFLSITVSITNSGHWVVLAKLTSGSCAAPSGFSADLFAVTGDSTAGSCGSLTLANGNCFSTTPACTCSGGCDGSVTIDFSGSC